MKRYGCLLAVLAFVFSSAAMAAPEASAPTTLSGITADTMKDGGHNFSGTDGSFEGPGLVHCEVGHDCTMTFPKKTAKADPCDGKPSLVSCQVGKGCIHKCEGEITANNANKTNRKAASVQKTTTTNQTGN